MKIRPIEPSDVAAIMLIQAQCPEIAQWRSSDYDGVARGAMTGWVAEKMNGIAGFVVARRVSQDVEILNFAVSPDARRAGFGTALMQEALHWAATLQTENIWLEVRESNLPALSFYQAQGFRIIGRRPRYYDRPVEDALLLAVCLRPTTSAATL